MSEYIRFDKTSGAQNFDFWGDDSQEPTAQNPLEALATSLEKQARATVDPFERNRLISKSFVARERARRGFTTMPDRG